MSPPTTALPQLRTLRVRVLAHRSAESAIPRDSNKMVTFGSFLKDSLLFALFVVVVGWWLVLYKL